MRPDPSAFVEGKGGGFQHKSKVCVFKWHYLLSVLPVNLGTTGSLSNY